MDYETSFKQFLAAAKKRREKAKKMHQQGLSYTEIGRQLGVTRQRAAQMIQDKPR
jgi:transposase-like protein